jgi:hypothetical protein
LSTKVYLHCLVCEGFFQEIFETQVGKMQWICDILTYNNLFTAGQSMVIKITDKNYQIAGKISICSVTATKQNR